MYINSENVDDYLVESITRPAADPNAREVYYRYVCYFPVVGKGEVLEIYIKDQHTLTYQLRILKLVIV